MAQRVVVMALMSEGRRAPASVKSKLPSSLQNSHRRGGFPPEDVIFDPNIFAVATGGESTTTTRKDFIGACEDIKRESCRTR